MADRIDSNINDYWDSQNGHLAEAPLVDANVAALIQQIHTNYAVTPPVSARERVRQRVSESTSVIAKESPVIATSLPISAPSSGVKHTESQRQRSMPHSLFAWVAVSAMLIGLLGGVASYRGYGPLSDRFGIGNESDEAMLPTAFQETVSPKFTFDWEVSNESGLDQQSPEDIAVGPDGTLWALDSDGTITRFDQQGKWVDIWDMTSDRQDGFSNDKWFGGIDVGANGIAYVADSAHGQIIQLGADRSDALTFGGVGSKDGQFISAFELEVDPDGNIYVADFDRVDVQKFSPDGTFLFKISGPPEAPFSRHTIARIEVDHEGNLYVTNGTLLQKFAPDGTYLSAIDIATAPAGSEASEATTMAFGDQGEVFVTDAPNNRVLVFSADGNYLGMMGPETSGPASFVGIGELAWHDGRLYVLDTGNRSVNVFDVTEAATPTS